MRNERIVTIFTGILLLIFVGGVIWLAATPMMPPQQKVEQTIPDDRIPR